MPRYAEWDDGEEDKEAFTDCKVQKSTDKALLVSIPDYGPRWIPKAVVHDDSQVFDDTENAEGILIIKGWFARKEQLC